MTRMERETAKNRCFNMAKEDGVNSCREYRKELEAKGYRTWLTYFTGDLFIVEYSR